VGKVSGFVIIFLFISFIPPSFGFCFEEAGELYGISPLLLRAIAEVESGFNPYAINWNLNSYDYGLMQINSSWASVIGLSKWLMLGDPCFNVKTGAWILRQCILRYGYSWEAIGCYNAGSPRKRLDYIDKVYMKLLEFGWR
jgi:soluble lytic murein transglycosylase-like protein